MTSVASSAPGASDEIDGPRAKLSSLQALIRGIIEALSKLEHSQNHRFVADFLIYFRRALMRLDRVDTENEDEIVELDDFVKEIERVASACLALIQQGNLIRPIDRISDGASASEGKVNYC